MELFEYFKLRWRVVAVLFVIGLTLVGLFATRGHDSYEASTQVVVRPPSALAGAYASDPDRYVNTQLAGLYLPALLNDAAEGARLNVNDLASSLTYTKGPSSEVVTLTISHADPGVAVRAVNAVADTFVKHQAASVLAPLRAQATDLGKTLSRVNKDYAAAGDTILSATNRYLAQHPTGGVPAASTLEPAAAARQAVLGTQLQQLAQQQSTILGEINGGPSSWVLRRAQAATPAGSGGALVYASAIMGVVFLLVFGLAASLVSSRRVIAESRWSRAVEGSALRTAIRVHSNRGSRAHDTVRQVTLALRAADPEGRAIDIVYLPEVSRRVSERSAFLVEALQADAAFKVHWADSLADLAATEPSHTNGALSHVGGLVDVPPVLLMVDLARCNLTDVRLVTECDPVLQRRLIPVLV